MNQNPSEACFEGFFIYEPLYQNNFLQTKLQR